MEIQKIDKNSIKIKGKKGSFVVDPTKDIKTKTPADAIVVLSKGSEIEKERIEECRLVIQGSGEYEFSGIKVSVSQIGNYLTYKAIIDGVEIFLANIEVLNENKDLADGSQIVVFNTQSLADQSLIAKITPQIVVLYGEKAEEQAKSMGKEITPVSKFQIKNEKLPEEMQVVCLT